MGMRQVHLDAKSIADAVDEAIVAAGTAAKAAHVAHAVTTGTTTPANAAYTLADQTALANAVLSLASKLNALLDALQASGLMAAS